MALKAQRVSLSVLTVLVILFSAVGGYYLGIKRAGMKPESQLPGKKEGSLFASQNATIRGKIIKLEGNKLTVVNSNEVTGEVEASDKILITKLSLNQKAPASSPSSDLKTLELNKDVYISLEFADGKYKAVLIQYLPPLPALPKLNATRSGAVNR